MRGYTPRATWTTAATVLLAGALWAASEEAARRDAGRSESPAARSYEPYELLAERNVFLSTRREPRPPVAPVAPIERDPTPPPDPRTDWVVRGTLGVDGGFAALVEHVRSGRTRTVQPGEEICGETVAGVTFDGLRLLRDANDANDVREVRVGRTLLGEQGAGAPAGGSAERPGRSARGGSGHASADDGPEDGGRDDGVNPVLLRLLQRRREERDEDD
jgi:hypothetical protein